MSSTSRPAEAGGKSIFLLGRSLGIGGAERQMVQLAIGLQTRGYRVVVGLFYVGGVLDSELTRRGIPIVDLGKRSRWDVAAFLARLVKALRKARPDVVYSFLGTANTVAALVRPLAPRFRLLWSIRASNMDLDHYDWASRLGYRIECALSGSPDLTISNSHAGLEFAAAHGFPRDRIVVVPNGIDTGRFRPDEALRREARAGWGLGDEEVAIGVLARLDPMKDHKTFLRAAALVAARRPDVRFLCIGAGPEDYRRELEALAEAAGIAGRVLWPGPAADPVPALNGLDIACSSSSEGEGFSNSVAEAMACGRPCVVTDVGDAALVVGDTGFVVPPKDGEALAGALIRALERLGGDSGARARARVADEFSADRMVERTIERF
ncbi:MAG TPA: glycosyltransferase [Allosphingosinicella sp.]|jgi:glycosyltransferase involved in cell wall biosynthesis